MNLLDLYAKISIDTKDYENGVKNAGESGEQLGKKSQEAGKKIKELGPLTVAAGKLIADGFEKAVGAVKNFINYSISSAMEYESSFAKVKTIMDPDEMGFPEMSDAIKNLSSQFGISTSEISDSVYDVISATGDTAHAIDLVEQATKLAIGGFTDTGSAVSVLATAINAYGMEATDAEAISNSLITVQNMGVTTVGQLASVMGKAIATASAYGVNLQNLEAGYIALTKAGIGTAEATTYLSGMMNELGDAGSDVSAILQERTGKTFGQLMESGKDMADVLEILYDDVDYDSEAFINLWGSAEAGKGAMAIVNQGFQSWEESMEALYDSMMDAQTRFDNFSGSTEEKIDQLTKKYEQSAGATEDAFEEMSKTSEYRMNVLKETFKNFAADAATPFMQKASDFIPKITLMIRKFDPSAIYEKFVKLKDILEKYEPVIAGVTAAIVAYEAATGIAAATTAIKTAMDAAGTTTLWGLAAAQLAANAPMIVAAAVIGVLIAAGVALYKNWDKVKEKCLQLRDNIVKFSGDMKNKVVDKYNQLKKSAGETWDSMKKNASEKWNAMKNGAVEKFTALKNNVSEKITGLKDNLSGKWESIKSSAVSKVESMKKALSEKYTSIKDGATNKISQAKDKLANTWDSIKNKASNTVGSMLGTITDKFEKIRSNIASKIEGARDRVKAAIDAVKGFLSGELKFPHIKVPHFKISGGQIPWGIGGMGTKPSVSVSWYAKAMDTGYMFTKPTVLGDKGFGDAGAEMVIGKNSMMSMISEAQRTGMAAVESVLREILGAVRNIDENMAHKIRNAIASNPGMSDREMARYIRGLISA